jgi:hypothetical protein
MPMIGRLGEGHSRYLVECTSDNCMDVFKESCLPKVGDTFHGQTMVGMRATKLIEGLYLVEVECEPCP